MIIISRGFILNTNDMSALRIETERPDSYGSYWVNVVYHAKGLEKPVILYRDLATKYDSNRSGALKLIAKITKALKDGQEILEV